MKLMFNYFKYKINIIIPNIGFNIIVEDFLLVFLCNKFLNFVIPMWFTNKL